VDARAQPVQRLRGHGGNQLPYIDKVVLTLAENLEVLNLRADRGRVRLPAAPPGPRQAAGVHRESGPGRLQGLSRPRRLRRRHDHQVQPELRRRPGDRQVVQHGPTSAGLWRSDRPRSDHETFWLGTGTPSSVVPADNNKYNPGPQYRKMWATARRKEGQRDAGQDRPRQRRMPRASGCAATARAGCASRS